MNHWYALSTLALIMALASLVSFLLTGVSTWYVRHRGLLDHPGERHSHTTATPTGGGTGAIAMILLLSVLPGVLEAQSAVWLYGILPGMVVLAFLGWADDLRSLSPWFRLLVQLAVSIYVIGYLLLGGLISGGLGAFTGVVVLVWTMNLFNFMDGSHGMAGFQALYAGLLLAVLFLIADEPLMALPCVLLAAAAAGFLPWNFPRPRVFMGDVASVPFGFLIGSLAVVGVANAAFHPGVALMIMSVFLTDATLTLGKRVITGERWYTAHKQHAYQRLIAAGWSHSRVLYLYQAINLFLVTPAIALAVMYPEHAWLFTGTCFLMLLSSWYAAFRRLGMRI